MPRVLHLGPYESNGGMRTVMRTLVEYPPDTWLTEVLATHCDGHVIRKIKKYFSSMKVFKKVCRSSNRPDIVHIHAASDWSWRRKMKFLSFALKLNIPCVVHLHSGNMYAWLMQGKSLPGTSSRVQKFKKITSHHLVQIVALNDHWKTTFESIGLSLAAISNPVHPTICTSNDVEKIPGKLLVLARNDPIKNHQFAVDIVNNLGNGTSLWMTGVTRYQSENIHSLGWITDEEVLFHLRSAEILLIPSAFEGQPMVALEALACGTKVLASQHVPEIPGVARVEGDTPQQWGVAIQNVLDDDRTPTLDEQFSIASVQKHWKEVYDSLLK
jgi:glycosyltransferase involved in cell wall biosynthesis